MSDSIDITKQDSQAIVDPDVHIPTMYVGKLDPNKYCRGWNGKRKKYCRNIAGFGTDHVGEGRCKIHGGTQQNLMPTRYGDMTESSVAELFEQLDMEETEAKMDILPEVTMIRALAKDMIERYEEIIDALLEWNRQETEEASVERRKPQYMHMPKLEEVSRVLYQAADLVIKLQKITADNAVPRDKFMRMMAEMSESVGKRVREQEARLGPDRVEMILWNIKDDWMKIR